MVEALDPRGRSVLACYFNRLSAEAAASVIVGIVRDTCPQVSLSYLQHLVQL